MKVVVDTKLNGDYVNKLKIYEEFTVVEIDTTGMSPDEEKLFAYKCVVDNRADMYASHSEEAVHFMAREGILALYV